MKEKYKRIINFYGLRNQLKKLSEEVYELQEAVLDYDNNKNKKIFKRHVEEELADVTVILTQLVLFLDLDRNKIIDVIGEKVNRQLERMEK